MKRPVPYYPSDSGKLTPDEESWFNLVSDNVVEIRQTSKTLTPTSVGANTTSEQTFTVNGIKANDILLAVTKPTHTIGIGIVQIRVSAANEIAISFMNNTAGSITPPSENYIIVVLRG